MQISPTQDQIQTSIRSFLLEVLPPDVQVIIAIQNRVPEPTAVRFAIISQPRFERSDTNIDSFADVKFTGSITPETASFTGSIAPAPRSQIANPSGLLTVSAIASGLLVVGGIITGPGVAAGTAITGQISGSTGGIGTYSVNLSQTVTPESLSESYGLMDVSSVAFGTILVDAVVFGVGVTPRTLIKSQGTGTGGIGTYIVSPSQTIGSQTLSSGAKIIQMNTKGTVQIDFHSGDSNSAADFAQTVSSVWRDEVGVRIFANQTPNYGVVPLYADDPRPMLFINDQAQAEWRYCLDGLFQVNQITSWPQEFSDELILTPVDVTTAYPA